MRGAVEETEEQVAEKDSDEEEAVPAEAVEASLDEILAKKDEDEGAADAETAEEEVAAIAPTGREERVEPLAVKVVPQQPTEFTCKKCFLVKHRSQLADKKRMYCRDCA